MFTLFIIAFIGGFLTIAAPCILAVLPIILGSTIGQQSRLRPFFIVLGLTVSFTGFGVLFQYVTNLFGLSSNTLRNIALVFLGVFGLALIFPSVFEKIIFHLQNFFNNMLPKKEPGVAPAEMQKKKGLLNGFFVGASLGLVWVPCAGPILGAILTLAVTQQDLGKVILLMLAYSLGAGLPMLLIAYGGNFIVGRLKFLKEKGQFIQKIAGAVLLAGVAFIAFGLDVRISTGLAELFPNLSKFEENLLTTSGLRGENQPPQQQENNKDTSSTLDMAEKILLTQKTPAPELTGTQEWINSGPLKLADLKGKVVIVDFWTYSCINCIRTLPYLTAWHETYKDKGLVIIGVHTPEFAFEKELQNVQKAVKDFGIKYPVVQDNDFATWRAYNNHYWPAKYIIDKEGNIRYMHFGEGKYEETEMVIQTLLGEESGVKIGEMSAVEAVKQDFAKIRTPEIYLGYGRAEYLGNDEKYQPDGTVSFAETSRFEDDKFYLSGEWEIHEEYVTAKNLPSKLSMNYQANKINIVADKTAEAVKARVFLDGQPLPKQYYGKDVAADGTVTIDQAGLYNVVDTGTESGRHTMTLEFLTPGVKAFTFTFG
jgi:cytochrome c biogenesis protein CcdA/thiol-disulfide isomerase/thioredoxin